MGRHAHQLGRGPVRHQGHRAFDHGPVPHGVHPRDGHGLLPFPGPVGLGHVGEGQGRGVLRRLQQGRRGPGMIEIRLELPGKAELGGHGVHHEEPLDAGHLVHGGVDVVAAQGLGHEPGHLHLAGEAFVQGPLPVLDRRAHHVATAGLPHQGLQVGDEDRDRALGPVPARVRHHHVHVLIPPLGPVGLGVEGVGQG